MELLTLQYFEGFRDFAENEIENCWWLLSMSFHLMQLKNWKYKVGFMDG
jgi:hypothetical protein